MSRLSHMHNIQSMFVTCCQNYGFFMKSFGSCRICYRIVLYSIKIYTCFWSDCRNFVCLNNGEQKGVNLLTAFYDLHGDGPGQFSRYSSSLRAGRSGDPNSIGVLGTAKSPLKWVQSLSQWLSGRVVTLTIHPYLAPSLKKEQSYTFTYRLGLYGLFQGEYYFCFALKPRSRVLYNL